MSGPYCVLIGPPGAGKTTVGSILASRAGLALRDTDADVEQVAGKPIPAIFADDGEPAFRALEHQAVVAALAEHDGVLSLGGGAILDANTREALAAYVEGGGSVVFLDVTVDHAAARIGFDQSRPLLAGDPRARWIELVAARRAIYEQVASIRVDTDGLSAEEVSVLVYKGVVEPGRNHRWQEG
jgi:shikimate kinase